MFCVSGKSFSNFAFSTSAFAFSYFRCSSTSLSTLSLSSFWSAWALAHMSLSPKPVWAEAKQKIFSYQNLSRYSVTWLRKLPW